MPKKLSKEQCDSKKEEVNTSLLSRSIKMVGDYVTTLTKSEFECSHGHRWFAPPSNVIRGSGCPHCAGQVPPNTTQIRSILRPRGITMIGEYTNMKTKTQFQCEQGHQWEAIPNNVLNKNRGCPCCNTGGYNPSKPGWIYVLKFDNFIKYGITNDIKRRLYEHLIRNGEYTIITSMLYEDGYIPQKLEQSIKLSLGGKFVTKEQCPDGYTETLCCTKLDQLFETIK